MDCLIELDIFSGLPNPQWRLSAEETNALIKKMEEQYLSGSKDIVLPSLGYRGLNIYFNNSLSATVCGGFISFDSKILIDKDQALELWLLSTAKHRIDEDVRLIALQEVWGKGDQNEGTLHER